MKNNKLYMIAALLGTALVGCQKEELSQPEETPVDNTPWTLTVKVTKAETKAMDLSGSTLNSVWADDETVNVFFGGTHVGTLTVSNASGATATLSGQVTHVVGLAKDSELLLLYPGRGDQKWSYEGQDGCAPSTDGTMATLFNYATSTLTVDNLDEVNHEIEVTGGTFTNEQSVYRFGFKVGGAGDPIAIKSLTVSSNQNKLVSSLNYVGSAWTPTYGSLSVTSAATTADNYYWMSIRNENTSVDDTYTFTVVRSSDSALLEGTKTIGSANLGNDKFLSAKSISVSQKALAPAPSGTISSEAAVL